MLETMARNWWAVTLRGVAAVIFGLLALFLPGLTVDVLAIWFGAYCLIDGIFALIACLRAATHSERWGALFLEAVISIIVGLIAIFVPAAAALALLYLVAGWSLLTGILAIVAAIRLREAGGNEWWLILSGVVSVLLGIILVASPVSGLIALVWLIGIYALIFGVGLIAFSFRLRSLNLG